MSLEDEIERRLRFITDSEEIEFPKDHDKEELELRQEKDEHGDASLIARYKRFFCANSPENMASASNWHPSYSALQDRHIPLQDIVELLVCRGDDESVIFSIKDIILFEQDPKIKTKIDRAIFSPNGKKVAFELSRYLQENQYTPKVIWKKDPEESQYPFYLAFKWLFAVNTDGSSLKKLFLDLPRRSITEEGVPYQKDKFCQALTMPVWIRQNTLKFMAREYRFKEFDNPERPQLSDNNIDYRMLVGLDFSCAFSTYRCRVRLDGQNDILESSHKEVAR